MSIRHLSRMRSEQNQQGEFCVSSVVSTQSSIISMTYNCTCTSNCHAVYERALLTTLNQSGVNSMTVAPWYTKIRLQMQVASKAAFLENCLSVSAWLLNGFLTELWHKKNRWNLLVYLVFDLEVGWFWFLGENQALKWSKTLVLFL